MEELKHLFPKGTAATEQYTFPRKVRGPEFKVPPRDDRVGHAAKLVTEIRSAEQTARKESEAKPDEERPEGVVLDFCSDPGFKLRLESLEVRRSGIELRNVRTAGDVMHATVFVPEGKVGIFIRKFEAYATENTTTDKPKNKVLVESINQVRLASLKSFWTEDTKDFPSERNRPVWWEIWLRGTVNPHDVSDEFRARAQVSGIDVSPREIRFPERRVLLARATVEQLLSVENLFDILAEVREAKVLPGEFLKLTPRDQATLIAAARSRIQPPSKDAPAVCHLDTGANRGHRLLEFALAEEHFLAVDPNWSPADQDGHGTEMAGLGLYGDLATVLQSNDPIVLRHQLESVKILRKDVPNNPDLYGEITSQAVSRIEIAAPGRNQRAFCLAVTADGRDEGYPSSWSAAVDQICAGVDEGVPKRLLFVSAGNTPRDGRHDYPDHNHLHGIQDPAQSYNALSVGAYTDKVIIQSSEYDDWQPIAEPGLLSPASSTSLIWGNKSWPLKPDIVMEGGNNAINPTTGEADYVDDLSLLTTHVSPDGALLTTTGDTSAATALAARQAAIIWAQYPGLWPETIRALLVHSARWTNKMRQEFPDNQRHERLRCYGYGVPNLQTALWSASNAATLVIEGSLQPFDKMDGAVKTRDMHLHQLPWPSQVLENLGEVEVCMRVTLSYFVEPSPGRRWTKKHRYQSHGLRFEVKRPHERDTDFHKRISRAAREEEEEFEHGGDDRNWETGQQLRSKGSIHRDAWTGSAVDLAQCGVIAVFPVTGWWKERAHLGCWGKMGRYSMIVTIETAETEVDLYTQIANQIAVLIDSAVEI